jgi:hypothetical protein
MSALWVEFTGGESRAIKQYARGKGGCIINPATFKIGRRRVFFDRIIHLN